MTGSELLARGTRALKQAGIDGAGRDARRLMAFALGTEPGRLTLVLPDPVEATVAERFETLIQRRMESEPVSHLVGSREFFGRSFRVTSDVLDPRPETETLIEAALAEPFDRVLDLGTGTGCLLLTLLAETDGTMGTGVDLSRAALGVARGNGAALGLSERVRWIESDWFSGVSGAFDLILSNPPYIAADEMAGLSRDVQAYEPRMALTDEGDGLSAYRAITAGVMRHLTPGGRLVVEIGPTQASAVAAMMTSAGLRGVSIVHDLDGRDRVLTGRHPD